MSYSPEHYEQAAEYAKGIKSPWSAVFQSACEAQATTLRQAARVDEGAIREVIGWHKQQAKTIRKNYDGEASAVGERFAAIHDAQADKLTRALSAEKAGCVGYCTLADAEKLAARKGEPRHNFTGVEVWNRQSEFYSVPVYASLPASPTPDKEG